MSTALLLISCPDQRGIVAKVTNFLYTHNANVENADQHIDSQTNTFFMRIEWSLEGFSIPRAEIVQSLLPLAKEFSMDYELSFTDQILRMAIFVSQHTHCLYDLLLRHAAGELPCVIPLIISNHPDAQPLAEQFNVRFAHCEKTADNKHEIEQHELSLLKEERIDLIVLARYMQILSPQILEAYPHRIINIHHSFLPAFAGGKPYHQAYQRGVKIIGATSHYVTQELDAGPIIEQNTIRVSHRDSLDDLCRKGKDLEKIVLGRAVRWHLERKTLVYNNKTVVFD